MSDLIDLTMLGNDIDRPSSPHNTRETAIVIDDSGDEANDDMARKMPAASAAGVQSFPGMPDSPPNNCAFCGKKGPKMGKCSLCLSVRYCSKKCQMKHWPEHKGACVKKKNNNPTAVKSERYAASTSARVSLSPTMNEAASSAAGSTAVQKRYSCSLCPQKFYSEYQKRKHEKKCRKKHQKKMKRERERGQKVKAEKSSNNNDKEMEEGGGGGGGVEEEADEITYNSYKPQKLTFGMDHPDPVVENSTLSAVAPPDVEYNLAMPADILSTGQLSSLQLEAIVYGCQRHLIDLPASEEPVYVGGEVVVQKPLRAGFLLGDGAGEW